MRTNSLQRLGLASSLVLSTCAFAACSGSPSTDGTGTTEDDLTSTASQNLLSDGELEGGQSITVSQVHSFLSGRGSYLASYESGGESAAAMIVGAARASKISPVYLLARIQGESSLIESGSSRGLSTATGCACPDGHGCSHGDSGFKAQVECTATLMRRYLDELDQSGVTVAGWAVGRAKRTLDPCTVIPANRATAAIYTYTPWVGYDPPYCGSSRSGGSTLLMKIFHKYANDPELADNGSEDGGSSEDSGDSGSSGGGAGCSSPTLHRSDIPEGACVQSASNDVWFQCQGGDWVRGVNEQDRTGPAGACTEWDPL